MLFAAPHLFGASALLYPEPHRGRCIFTQRSRSARSFAVVSSVDSLDWKGISAAEITERVTSRVQPGSIVLFHNAAKHTPEALPSILENLIGKGYTIVPISQLICKGECGTDYTIDHTGKQFRAGGAAGSAAA